MQLTTINGKWELLLPDHRAERAEWNINRGGWEVKRIQSLMDNIKDTDIVFDIGAEEGDMSGLFATKAKGMVLFEPNPRVWPNIRAIWEANKLPTPLGWYIGFASSSTNDNPDRLDFDNSEKDGWPSVAYGPLIRDHGFRHLAHQTNTTPQVKLDDYCKRINVYPDILTIDVDGSELEVMKGMEHILREKKPMVYISIHPEIMFDHFEQYENDFHSFMGSVGYANYHLEFAHEHHYCFWHPEGRKPVEDWGD